MLSNLELEIISRIIKAEAREYPEIAMQIEYLEILSREYTGTGFITNLKLKRHKIKLIKNPDSITLGQETVAYLGKDRVLAGFVLYVDSGQISALEGFTYGGPWPEDADTSFDIQ